MDPLTHEDAYASVMRHALDEARAALESGDVPIGAVVLDASGTVIAAGHNEREAQHERGQRDRRRPGQHATESGH